jgi:hypothetical protein
MLDVVTADPLPSKRVVAGSNPAGVANKSLNHNDSCKINLLSVIPAKAGTQGPQGSKGCPGPPLSRGRRLPIEVTCFISGQTLRSSD